MEIPIPPSERIFEIAISVFSLSIYIFTAVYSGLRAKKYGGAKKILSIIGDCLTISMIVLIPIVINVIELRIKPLTGFLFLMGIIKLATLSGLAITKDEGCNNA